MTDVMWNNTYTQLQSTDDQSCLMFMFFSCFNSVDHTPLFLTILESRWDGLVGRSRPVGHQLMNTG